jgi:hypothetical protein
MVDNPYAETLLGAVKVYNLDRGTNYRYLRIDCPWCDENFGKRDTAGHLHFYLDSSIARCMRCGAWGTVPVLFSKLGLVLPVAYETGITFPGLLREKFDLLFNLDPNNPNSNRNAKTTNLPEPPEIELPYGTLEFTYLNSRIPFHRRPLKIVESWKLDFDILLSLRWGWNGDLDSFIFPVYNERGGLVFWSSRAATGSFRRSAETEFAPYGILGEFFNPLRKSTEAVYLVEGPKDAAALSQEGFWGVYLFGHNPNAAQIARLNSIPHTKVLLLDADVSVRATEIAEREGERWKVVYLPSGDPADYAGRLTGTLADLWETQTSSRRDSKIAEMKQRLHNTQIHRTARRKAR